MSDDIGVHNLKDDSSFRTALQSPGVMVLDCFATWCGPCKAIAPKIVQMSHEHPNVKFFKLDVDEVPETAQELGIRAMPTFLIFRDGEKVGEVVGAQAAAIKAAVEEAERGVPAKADE